MSIVRGAAYRTLEAGIVDPGTGPVLRWSNPWQAPVASWALQIGVVPGLYELTLDGADPEIPIPTDFGTTIGVWGELFATPTFENGTVGATGWAPVYFPPTYDVDELDGWALEPEVVIASQVTRERAHLSVWPDGTAGWLPIDDGVLMLAAGGAGDGGAPGIGVAELDRHGRWVDVVDHEVQITGLDPSLDYAAGGPVLVNPETGTVALVYHAEVYVAGPTVFTSALGLARSTDGGATFEDLGVFLSPGIDVDEPAESVDVGSGPLVVVDGLVLVYAYEYEADVNDVITRTGLTVAGCSTGDWWSAVEAGSLPPVLKWDGADFTIDPVGLTPGTPVLEHPCGRWVDVVEVDGSLVLVASDGGYRDWCLIASTSPDGVTWAPVGRIPGSTTSGDERVYVSASSARLSSTPKSVTATGRVWVWRPVAQVGTGYERWGDVALTRQALTVALP